MRCKNGIVFLIAVYVILVTLSSGFADEGRDNTVGIDEDEKLFHETAVGRGKLYITVKSKGAKISLNGELTTYEAPVTIPDLVPGRYEVKVKQKGRRAVVKTVWIKEGETTEIEFKLPNRIFYGCLVSASAVVIITTAIITALAVG